MTKANTITPRIVHLADQLVADIEARKLKPGDRYLATADASKLLGVGNGLANRALQLLERRQIITRQQRRGAFVARPVDSDASPSLRRIHFLVHQNYLMSEGIGNDLVLLGIQRELPEVDVQISFLPVSNATEYVEELIDDSFRAKTRDGFILVRTPYEVQQLVSNRGVPAVVYGELYPGISGLTRFNRDMESVGRIAAEFLLSRGHEQIGYLARQQVLPGDHATMDAIRRAMAERGLLADALVERFLPSMAEVCEAAVYEWLKAANRPTAFICRSRMMAKAASRVFTELGLVLYRDIDLALCDYYMLPSHEPEFVYPKPIYSSEEQGSRMAALLAARSRNVEAEDVIIPVELDTSAADRERFDGCNGDA
ncbi:MAG: substrate-binding domain-containing protein [Pirellulales bacterium]